MNNEIQISQRDTFQDIKKDLYLWPITPIQMTKREISAENSDKVYSRFYLFESFNFQIILISFSN